MVTNAPNAAQWHPTETELANYARGEAGTDLGARIDGHIDSCGACRERCDRIQISSHHEFLSVRRSSAPLDAAGSGRYEVGDKIGEGGAGVVYRARDKKLKQDVAVKMIRFAPNERDHLLNATHEAYTIAKAKSVGVVPIHDVFAGVDHVCIVMDWMPNGSLADRLCDPISPRQAARILLPIAEASQKIFNKGIRHRDLKPANILFDHDGPKIADFSIALAPGDSAAEGDAPGTRWYMAPEQLRGHDNGAGASTDVWPLGIILYQMLHGALPYQGSRGEILAAIEREAPPKFGPEVPAGLAEIGKSCLRKDQAARYGSPQEVATALRNWLNEAEATVPTPRPRPRLLSWAALLLVVLTPLLGWTVLRSKGLKSVTALPPSIGPGEQVVLIVTASKTAAKPQTTCRVHPGGSLTIKGAGTLSFAADQGIISEGRLELQGESAENRLMLASADPKTPWNGIALSGPGANESTIANVRLESAHGWRSAFDNDPLTSMDKYQYEAPMPIIDPQGPPASHQRVQRRGGALTVAGCKNVKLIKVEFRQNQAELGGAVFYYGSDGGRIDHCDFTDNRSQGRALSPGGALYVQNSHDLVIDTSTFVRNRAMGTTYSSGGAIYAGINVIMRVVASKFRENSCTYVGGAIYCLQLKILKPGGNEELKVTAPEIRLLECDFHDDFTVFWKWDNRPEYLAGNEVFVNNGYEMNVSKCTFENRHSPGPLFVGEGLYKDDNNGIEDRHCDIEIRDSTFRGAQKPDIAFPRWLGAKALGLPEPAALSEARDRVKFEGNTRDTPAPEPDQPIKFQAMHLPQTCFAKSAGERAIDTVVVHYGSAVNWATANDEKFNARSRLEAFKRLPALEKLTNDERTFSPEAFRAILEIYGFSSHYAIGRDGTIYEFVPMNDVAWHAGQSEMPRAFDPEARASVNRFSVGIELIATAPADDPRVRDEIAPAIDPKDLREPHPAFTIDQYRSLRRLIRHIDAATKGKIRYIVGHDEIAPGRKVDPGRLFDWSAVRDDKGVPFTTLKK